MTMIWILLGVAAAVLLAAYGCYRFAFYEPPRKPQPEDLIDIPKGKIYEVYREKMETAVTDERSQFIRAKAWSWAGYLFILVSAIATIICKLLGQDLLCQFASGAVCLMLVLYWISYFVLKKKY